MDEELKDSVRGVARRAGYVACGVTSPEPFERFSRALEERIRRFPEAAHLYRGLADGRADVRSRLPWARSLVVCVHRYGKYKLPAEPVGHIGRLYLVDRRFPECPDHAIPERMQKGLEEMGLRSATVEVPVRWAGARAGVSRWGRNCFAYTEHGSWIVLHVFAVDAALPPDEPTLEPACPEGCRACIEACPTGALVEPFLMRWDRCIPHLTYRAPHPIAPELWERMGGWIYGCDVCQQVCPLNRGEWEELEEAPWLDGVARLLTPEALSTMDRETYREIVHPRFWYIPLDDLERWHVNARRALANAAPEV